MQPGSSDWTECGGAGERGMGVGRNANLGGRGKEGGQRIIVKLSRII